MKIFFTSVVTASFTFLLVVTSWAATIVSPIEDEEVYAGSEIAVVVKPGNGEEWQGFVLEFQSLKYDPVNNIYKTTIKVPLDILGSRDDLRIVGVDKAGHEIQLRRRVFVKLPSNAVLQTITSSRDVMVIYKLSSTSDMAEKERRESRNLRIWGVYSDGVNRDLTSSISGTTYVSSNEEIVTVNSEGKVTSKGIGTANITVRNGKYSASVRVVVKAYKK